MSPNPSTAAPDSSRFGFTEAVPTVTAISAETADGVTVTDLTFEEPGVAPTEAYLVAPASGPPRPGIVWFHWLEYGNPTSNRTEFLDEARAMAQLGAVSLLVQGNFPWNESPASIDHDVAAVEADVRMLHSGLQLLATRPETDPEHLVLVGHDFGGMYSSVLFGADHHIDGLIVMAPTARWGDWFYRYWQISDPKADYLAAMAPLDPMSWLPFTDGRPVLLQFAANDQYVPEDVADEITSAAGATATAQTYVASHHLNDVARADRDAWLAETLGLAAPE